MYTIRFVCAQILAACLGVHYVVGCSLPNWRDIWFKLRMLCIPVPPFAFQSAPHFRSLSLSLSLGIYPIPDTNHIHIYI